MSVTLIRYKDGKPAPLKLSVWDAFKGIPVPKPRPHRCSCCNEFHSQRVITDPATDSPSDGKSGEPSKAGEKPDTAADDNDGFSAEDDHKLQAMKKENKTWAVIIAEMRRPKKDLQNRLKKLEKAVGDSKPEEKKEGDDAKGGNGQKGEDGGKKNKEKSEKNSAKEEKAKKAREEGLKRKAEKEGKKEEDAKKDSKAEIPATVVEATKPAAINVDDKQKWIAAASKHFDHTGHRITPQQARKLAEAGT